MPIKVLIKLVILLTALTACIVAIFWLKQGHMKSFWTSLGLERTGTRINWCDERVASLHMYDSGAKLVEKDGKWLWVQGDERTLDYLRVEKWFAKYCQVGITPLAPAEISELHPIFEAVFINGDRISLHQGQRGHFKMRDQVFKSETLQNALKELLAFDNKIE